MCVPSLHLEKVLCVGTTLLHFSSVQFGFDDFFFFLKRIK